MQQVLRGIKNIGNALKGANRVLLVCDSSFPYLCIKDEIEGIGLPYFVFNQFTPNPLYQDVCKGVDMFQKAHCDTILAVGGGSSLDVAKCIKLFCKMGKDTLYLEQAYCDTGVKLIAIPTTAGTGSESTRYAVIYYNGKKQSVTHDSIVPNVVILEPKVLKTLPLYQKKCTMMDALCQGIESWWSINSTDASKSISREVVETIMRWWHEYIFENTDVSAEAIMHAANLSGQAICVTQTTAPHAFSYKITSLYQLPHGHAVALCLPEIWVYMLNNMDKCTDVRGKEYLSRVFFEISKSMGCESPVDAIEVFRRMLAEMELRNPLPKNRDEELEVLSTSVNPVRLKNNPVELNDTGIREIYNIILSHL
ncbi:MAG: phosphonoacetaldehyde reductase [Prevotella sp.]|nr:phosphonoacetaldehyde reductase [Prevotella sp.]